MIIVNDLRENLDYHLWFTHRCLIGDEGVLKLCDNETMRLSLILKLGRYIEKASLFLEYV